MKRMTKREIEKRIKADKPKPKPKTDMERVIEFFEKNELPYEHGTNDGIRPYLFINFDDDGSATEPR